MKLKLPDVTVVAIDNVAQDLLAQALDDTLGLIDPAEVIVWTDTNEYDFPNYVVKHAEPHSFVDVGQILWYDVPRAINTTHYLVVQWDSWVINPDMWSEDWLAFDYLGAPWWYKENNVGNGGFSLRSADLGKYLIEKEVHYHFGHPEDEQLCRRYRPRLERLGFLWGNEYAARRFAFERTGAPPTFGFHGIFNWPRVLGQEALRSRLELVNDYVRRRPEFQPFWAEVQERMANA